jgi:hypothetical protein
MNSRIVAITIAAVVILSRQAHAEVFKSPQECVTGTRVVDSGGKHGRITGMSRYSSTSCMVAFDEGGAPQARIFWMLHAEGQSAETDDKLVPGTYECYANLRYTFMDVLITGANTYQAAGKPGKFHVEPSRKIVFETGTLAKYHAKLLRGPSIGLNTNGGTFWSTTCDLKKK